MSVATSFSPPIQRSQSLFSCIYNTSIRALINKTSMYLKIQYQDYILLQKIQKDAPSSAGQIVKYNLNVMDCSIWS